MKKPFCLYLTNQARLNRDNFEPCCWFTKKLDLPSTTPAKFSEYRTWLAQIDDFIPECNFCYEKEIRNVMSPRQIVNETPMPKLGIERDSADIGKITSLELQIDTNCNAACLICGEHNSSTWKKYNIGSIDNKSNSNKKINVFAQGSTQQRYRNLKKYIPLDNINTITFLGGEPLDSDFHKQVIRDLTVLNPTIKLNLCYTTNGSKQPDDETVELWRQANSVRIRLSLDGIGEHFNYLRWPLQWSQVEHNIQYFIDLKLNNVSFDISSAITPFNIFYYDQYLDWETKMFKNVPNKFGRFSWAFDAIGIINTSSIPEKLMDVIREKYADHPWLVNRMRQYDPVKFAKFMQYIKLHDSKRNQNWREVFPEIVKYFE